MKTSQQPLTAQQQAELRAHYNPDGSPLRKLQLQLTDILVEWDHFAKEHHIEYSLAFGTLLGAIRHEGFIPWDDDADVMMTREQYEQLRRIAPNGQLNEHLSIRGIARPEIHYNGKGFVDIFIFDYAPDSRLLDFLKTATCSLLSLLVKCKSRMQAHYYGRPKPWFILMPLAAPFSLDTLVRWKDKASKWLNHPLSPNEQVRMYRTGGPKHMMVKLSYGILIGEHINVNFDGHSFPAIPQYDAYLRVWYNDYMQLPHTPTNLGRVTDSNFVAIR